MLTHRLFQAHTQKLVALVTLALMSNTAYAMIPRGSMMSRILTSALREHNVLTRSLSSKTPDSPGSPNATQAQHYRLTFTIFPHHTNNPNNRSLIQAFVLPDELRNKGMKAEFDSNGMFCMQFPQDNLPPHVTLSFDHKN